MILVDVVRSALMHLSIDKCPRCLVGELIVDVARSRFDCSRGCDDVAGAIGEATKALTGPLKGEGATLAMMCRKANRVQLDARYVEACMAVMAIERAVGEMRRAELSA